ncbi:hypothetical protein [Aestuariivirga sp.]|uniref:hypothetical protein n=1 Tax=Aestuariivirga sp. TaxID=2650926 RepID=UPI0035945822
MATTEHTINDALAEVLRTTRTAWRETHVVNSENTSALKGSNKRPDIVIVEANVSPVVIETEVVPAVTVEQEAIERLGVSLRVNGRQILSAVAVRMPLRFRNKSSAELQSEITNATDLEFCLFTGVDDASYSRWPKKGWLTGGVSDLSIIAQSASVPPDVIEKAADQLVYGVSEAAGLLAEVAKSHPNATLKIGLELKQEDDDQTRRMAATIVANAFVFHETLSNGAGALAEVRSLDELRGSGTGMTKSVVLAEWRKILKVNYWPIFDIARRILEAVPATHSKTLIDRLSATADQLLENRLMRSHDLTGAVFQRLIADRKFLAAYYTTPASAALLVGLAIQQDKTPASGNWSDANGVSSLRVADFACGTGTLLSTAYQRMGQLHELAGGDSEALHPKFMAQVLVGCDVLPAAAHLTASMLAGAHPTSKFDRSSIMTVAYGKQPNGGVALGSLDLLDPQGTLDILSITAKAAEGLGEKEKDTWASLPHASFDLALMNPPFTRPTGHEGKKIGVPNPMFAAFASSEEEQKVMGKAVKRLTTGTSAHGNAGEASIFLVLAHRKLKETGTLALVMPLSLMAGDAWEESRKLLAKNYGNLVLVSISGIDGAELSFSADTSMGECLVIGERGKGPSTRATFAVLSERPAYPMLGAAAAHQIRKIIASGNVRKLEDGPLGGTRIQFGADVIGQVIDAPIPSEGGWNLSRVADLSLAQTSYQITHRNRIWLPGTNETAAHSLPVTTIEKLGHIGPYHMDINAEGSKGAIRGPFEVIALSAGGVPTYPILWSHDATREFTMSFDAECEGIVKKGKDASEDTMIADKVSEIVDSASHCHFNRDFRFNSQATSMQFTPRRTIGGRAWLSIKLKSEKHEKALVVWANTSLGMLLHWWHANKQQAGRCSIGKTSLLALPTLDVDTLTTSQLDAAAKVFDDFSARSLKPLHEVDTDSVRAELDERFLTEVLGVPAAISGGPPMSTLRAKMASEPSILGHKD